MNIFFISGLQMWINMKPYTNQLYSRTAIPYTISIAGKESFIDHNRKLILIRPGKETMIKVIPRLVETTSDYDYLGIEDRNCKLSHETDGLESLTNYTRIGCELECALQKAKSVCKCIPWHIPSKFKELPMCEMFGGYCFDQVMSDETNYWNCKHRCLKDCHETAFIVLDHIFPMDYKKICQQGSFHDQHFRHNFQRHFAFHNYMTLIEERSTPDLTLSYKNGSLCEDYVRNYVGFVNVYSPSSYIIVTERDKAVFFYDQLGVIGGTFGLFVGMSMLSFAEVGMLLVTIVYQFWLLCKDPLRNGDFSSSLLQLDGMNYSKRMRKLEDALQVSILMDLYFEF